MDARIRSHRRAGLGLLRRAGGIAVVASVALAAASPATAAPTPSVTIGDVTLAEGNAGTTNATFTIQASPPPRPSSTLQVTWSTAPGSATAPSDFTTSSGTVSLTKASPARTVTVPVVGDARDEADEAFTVNLSSLVGSPGTIGDASAIGTITDDDPLPALSVNDVSIAEGNAGTSTLSFAISLSAASARSVSVAWATTPGTATAGTDYVAAVGSRTIAAGSTSATVGITVNGDALDEDDETFGISLSAPTNATIADAAGAATIADDDPLPLLSVNDVSVVEGNAGTATLTFTVTLSAASGRTVTVPWATADDEAVSPSDYAAGSGTLTFVPGDTSETVGVTLNGDVVAELDERFLLTLTSPSNATVADGQGFGTLLDDEGLPVLDLDAPSTAEGDAGTGPLTFTVSLSNPSALPVTVDWSTGDATAAAGEDYVAASGTVSFAPLDVSETVVVDVLGEILHERDETLAVELSNATNAPIGRTRRLGTIVDDDVAPVVSVADASVVEGNNGAKVVSLQVSLSEVSGTDATVGVDTTDGTATAGVDYGSSGGTLTIPAGVTSATVDVTVNGDTRFEPDETFSVALSAPAEASIGDGDAVGTIVNDDKAPTSLTLKVTRGRKLVTATGVLEPTKAGHRVTVTLSRLRADRFVRVAAKTVTVRRLGDRDGDGKIDGTYLASFTRPALGGTYKIVARFKGGPTFTPSTRSKRFTLPPR